MKNQWSRIPSIIKPDTPTIEMVDVVHDQRIQTREGMSSVPRDPLWLHLHRQAGSVIVAMPEVN